MSETVPSRVKNRRRRFKSGKNKCLAPYRRHRSTKQHLFQIAMIMIAIWCYKQYSKSQVYCKNALDPFCPDKYFNDNYTNARHQFLTLSSTINNANTYHLPIYKLQNDNYLYTDITIINEDSKSNHLIIHLSGTHGVEGHAGSAIQLSLLEYISNITNNQATSQLFENYTFNYNLQCNADMDANHSPIIMLVHALNPYGFHFGRRVNENNVDLNRNYKTSEEWDALIAKDRNVFGYQDLNALFNPKYDLKLVAQTSSLFVRSVWLAWYYLIFFPKVVYYAITVGSSHIASALIPGQWFDPTGVQYNGEAFKLETSHEMLQDFIANKLFEDRHSEWKEQINKISLIDVHTGLGKYGWDTLLLMAGDENDIQKLNVLMPDHMEKDLIVRVRDSFDGVYEHVNGFTSQHVLNLVKSKLNGKEMDNLMLPQEFGTYDQIYVLAAFRFENGITNAYNGYVEQGKNEELVLMERMDELVNMSRKRLKDVFYVEYVDWKKDIVQKGFNLFTQIL